MPLYSKNKTLILFMHIPKTGGTTIEGLLKKDFHFKEALFSQNCLPDNKSVPQHFGIETTRKLLGDLNSTIDFTFAIVRNPYERLESEFFYRIKMGELKLGSNPERYFAPWVRTMLKEFNGNENILENHLQPQTYFVDKNVVVFKFEDGFESLVSEISTKLKAIPPKEITSKKVGEKKLVYWDFKLIKLVQSYYRSDFETFGYAIDEYKLNRVDVFKRFELNLLGAYFHVKFKLKKSKMIIKKILF